MFENSTPTPVIHWRRPNDFRCIDVRKLRILGARFRIFVGGVNSQQAYDVVLTSMRRNDVASTSF